VALPVRCFLFEEHSIAEGHLFNQSQFHCINDVLKCRSKWIKKKNKKLFAFHWQDGYGAFSISPSHVEALKKYIADQPNHHRRETFQDEFRRLLKKYGIEYDERYVWD
jgi:putative transposase